MVNTEEKIGLLARVMAHDEPEAALQAFIEGLSEKVTGRVIWSPGPAQSALGDMQGAQHVYVVDPSILGGGQIIFFPQMRISAEEKKGLDRQAALVERWIQALLEIRRLDQEVQQAVAADPLTGVLTSRAFFQQTVALLDQSQKEQKLLACLHIDLIGFKAVNDQLGDDIGDELLFALADRLRRLAGAGHVGRLGPDEFGVLLQHVAHESMLRDLVKTFAELLQRPPIPSDLWNGARIGVSVFPVHAKDAQSLLHEARQALLSTKFQKKPAVAFFGGPVEFYA